MKKYYATIDAGKPEEIIEATQKALIRSMRSTIHELEQDCIKAGRPDILGMSWSQLDFFLSEYEKKKPTVIQLQQGEPF